jgi:broad specificity phosphatase PhoE
MSGRADLPLSRLGVAQVAQLAKYFATQPAFDVVYASPLRRARDTAAACVSRAPEGVRLCPALQEIDCGTVDGLPIDIVQREFAPLWEENLAQSDDEFSWPGGESYAQLRERCLAAVQRICAAHPEQRVALVTHAGVISQLLGWLHGVRPACWEQFRPGNASITELLWKDATGELLRYDQHEHLS